MVEWGCEDDADVVIWRLMEAVNTLERQLRCYHSFDRDKRLNVCKKCGLDKPLPDDSLDYER